MFNIFATRFDGDLKYLVDMHKRVDKLADANAIPDVNNKLWILWSNLKLMLDKNDSDYYTEIIYFTAVMCQKIELYSKNNLLDGDKTVSKILYEMDMLKPCDYKFLKSFLPD